jgi:signal transduction histidine kinase
MVTASIDSDIPRFVTSDPGRLHQVLLNLVSNAIKFTPRGNVTLKVQLASHVSQSIEEPIVDFIVLDTGNSMHILFFFFVFFLLLLLLLA